MHTPMTVSELIAKLKNINGSKEVCFQCGYNAYDIDTVQESSRVDLFGMLVYNRDVEDKNKTS